MADVAKTAEIAPAPVAADVPPVALSTLAQNVKSETTEATASKSKEVGDEVKLALLGQTTMTPTTVDVGRYATEISHADLLSHAAQVDAKISGVDLHVGETTAEQITGKLARNDKPHDSVGSTQDMTGKNIVQADGGFTGPGTSSYVGTAMDASEAGRQTTTIQGTAKELNDPAASGWAA